MRVKGVPEYSIGGVMVQGVFFFFVSLCAPWVPGGRRTSISWTCGSGG